MRAKAILGLLGLLILALLVSLGIIVVGLGSDEPTAATAEVLSPAAQYQPLARR